jgi:hypothetical protein
VQKKEKDRVPHENVLNVQDPYFFGQLIACPRWHADSIVLNPLLVHAFLQRFPFGRAAFCLFFFITRECRMLKRVLRVRAARAT